MDPAFLKTTAISSQILFLCAGLVLLWFHVVGPAARARHAGPRLASWDASILDVLVFFFHGLAGGFIGSFAVGVFSKPLGLHGDPLTITATAALHFGALLGIALHLRSSRGAAPTVSGPGVLLSGVGTFLIAMPFVYATNVGWLALLKHFGVDVARQPAVEMVGRLGLSPWMLLFITFAILVAPAAEELLFRAGLFRYLRTRQRSWIALVVPSLLFAAIHFHLPSYLPLAVLGIVFSLAYERTGLIGTPIVAHGLFNLNNLLMLLAGVDQ